MGTEPKPNAKDLPIYIYAVSIAVKEETVCGVM